MRFEIATSSAAEQRIAPDLAQGRAEARRLWRRPARRCELRWAPRRRGRSRRWRSSMPWAWSWASSASTSSSINSSAWTSSSSSDRLMQPRSSPREISAATSGREVSSCATPGMLRSRGAGCGQAVERAPEQPRDVHLRHPDPLGDLRLGSSSRNAGGGSSVRARAAPIQGGGAPRHSTSSHPPPPCPEARQAVSPHPFARPRGVEIAWYAVAAPSPRAPPRRGADRLRHVGGRGRPPEPRRQRP